MKHRTERNGREKNLVLLDQIREAVEQSSSLGAGFLGPRLVLKCSTSSFHGHIDISLVARSNL